MKTGCDWVKKEGYSKEGTPDGGEGQVTAVRTPATMGKVQPPDGWGFTEGSPMENSWVKGKKKKRKSWGWSRTLVGLLQGSGSSTTGKEPMKRSQKGWARSTKWAVGTPNLVGRKLLKREKRTQKG